METRVEPVAEVGQDSRAEHRTGARAGTRTDPRAEIRAEPPAPASDEATQYQQTDYTSDYQQNDYQQSDYQQSDYQSEDYQQGDYQQGEHQLVEHQLVEQPGITEAPAVAQQAVRETHAHTSQQQSGREAHALVEQHSLVDSRGVEHTYSRPGQGADLAAPQAPRTGQPGPTTVQPMPVLPPPVYQAPSGGDALPVLPPPVYQPSASESVTAEMSPAELAELRAALADPAAPPPAGVRRGGAEEVPAPSSMQLPASVDAKLNDRERDLLRQLHEELAQREKKSASESTGGWQVNRNQPNGYGQRGVPGAWGSSGPAPETGNAPPPPNQNRGGNPYSSAG